MVMAANFPAFSPEFEKMKSDLYSAREKYTVLVEHYTHLTGVVGDNLEVEYMMKLGKKEHELFSCRVEILRLKREIALFQAARNRGETITADHVRKVIEKEFADYQKEIEKQKEKLKLAKLHFSAKKFTPEESKQLKKLYHDIVRKLHPDLNPHLPEGASALWDSVQYAYEMNDWDELALLADMVDEFLGGKKDYVETINSMERLKQELEKIRQKTSDLEKQIAETLERVPFSYEKLLNDPAKIRQMRDELDEQIALHNEHIEQLKQLRAEAEESK